jgi:hypothetical protein
MIALCNHYSGEGNTSRRIAVAEKTRDTLHYKSERAMSFSSFLDKLQKMFNIFNEEGEAISETAKVRLLLKKVKHPQLQDAIGALRVRSAIDGITFTECANHLAALVSEIPDQQSSGKISSATTNTNRPKFKTNDYKGRSGKHKSGGGGKHKGIYMPDGSVFTGHYDEWTKMSEKDRQTVIEARTKNRGRGNRNHKDKDRNSSEVSTNSIKSIRTKLDDLSRSLSAIKTKSDDESNDSPVDVHAGDSFGGRQSKRLKKE